LKSISSAGYTHPTPIQAQAIPVVVDGRDLLAIAQTGTGKTAAFALPILHQLASTPGPKAPNRARALVLAPTRELAAQIAESFRTYGRHLPLTVAQVFGGVSLRAQVNAMRKGVDILVATPGRLIQHLEDGNINLGGTELIVLDEADQMLDMGFIQPIRQILAELPKRRQSLMFSATLPREIDALAAKLLHKPAHVTIASVGKTADRVTQRVMHVTGRPKRSVLVDLFADPDMQRSIVFTRTKRGADRLVTHLAAAGIKVSAIHGNKSQRQREQALNAFRRGAVRGLVATDIAARGIDVADVTHVVNFDLPEVPEAYVHRIGRTARAGNEGIAISFCDRDEVGLLRDIERLTQHPIKAVPCPGETEVATPPPQRERTPRNKSTRPAGSPIKPSARRNRRKRTMAAA